MFGLALIDLFSGSPWKVELETDLSIKQQFLDIVVLRRGPGEFSERLPDGLEPLADYNLLSYKSLHEPMDDWVLKELTGHYVNYRKQIATSNDNLAAEDQFRLFGVCTRYPRKLSEQVTLKPVQSGVYEISRGTDEIRIIVLNEMPLEAHISLWLLFGIDAETTRFGAEHLKLRTSDTSTILSQFFLNALSRVYQCPIRWKIFVATLRLSI